MKSRYKILCLTLIFLLCLCLIFEFFTSGKLRAFLVTGTAVASITILLYLYFSFTSGLKKINSQLQVALSGSFTTDFPEKISNELDLLAFRLSSLFKDIKQYDSIRAKDVTKSVKACSILTSNISEAVIMIDFEDNSAILNPAAQNMKRPLFLDRPLGRFIRQKKPANTTPTFLFNTKLLTHFPDSL